MTNNDPLANILSHIINYERVGKKQVTMTNASSIVKDVLRIMHEKGYLGSFEIVQDSKGDILTVELLGTINECGVIKPRFQVGKEGFEKYEKRFLPSKNFGLLIVSTNKGLMTHIEAKEQGLGGTLISYCY
jgi:small subunit ribosomal protein S8